MGLVELIKKIALGVVEAQAPFASFSGTVSRLNPLTVNVNQRFTLSEDFLIVPESLTEYKLVISGTEYVIRKGLAVGDKLILLREQGGQNYIVMDRVV